VNWRSYETLVELGDKGLGTVGLAISPLDGFVAVEGAKRDFSQMVTRSFSFSGRQLHLNVRSHLTDGLRTDCDVRVEILTPNHEPLPGFGFKDADPITTSGYAQVASWNGQSDLSELTGKTVKLRFYFRNAKLYSFQFK